jgi:ankyrin repeat protein
MRKKNGWFLVGIGLFLLSGCLTAQQEILKVAIYQKNLDGVKAAISQDGLLVHRTYRRGETPLHMAAIEGSVDIVRFLITQGADVNAVNNRGQTPLHMACYYNRLDIVKYLVSRGADIDAGTEHTQTPLLFAIFNDHIEVIKYLLSQGSDVNARDE